MTIPLHNMIILRRRRRYRLNFILIESIFFFIYQVDCFKLFLPIKFTDAAAAAVG